MNIVIKKIYLAKKKKISSVMGVEQSDPESNTLTTKPHS